MQCSDHGLLFSVCFSAIAPVVSKVNIAIFQKGVGVAWLSTLTIISEYKLCDYVDLFLI